MDLVALNDLAAVLGLGDHEHVAIVGGGGKTTTMHALGAQLDGSRVITTTTKMGHDQARGLPLLLGASVDEVAAAAHEHGAVVAWKAVDGQKAIGVDPATCDAWFSRVDHVIIEADGSRRRPFKAPAEYEPVVPATTTTMVSVIGADALGRVIADQCHRPLRVAALAECSAYERLTPQAAARVLLHERGARKELPTSGRLCVAVTKVDERTEAAVGELVDSLADIEPELTIVPVEFTTLDDAEVPR